MVVNFCTYAIVKFNLFENFIPIQYVVLGSVECVLGMRSIFELGLQVLECEKNVSKNGIVGFEIWKTKLKPRPKELKQKKK